MMFDVCVVGHVTKDLVRTAEGEFEMPGGTAYYTAIALKNLGMRVAVITKLLEQDVRDIAHAVGQPLPERA